MSAAYIVITSVTVMNCDSMHDLQVSSIDSLI